MTEPILRFSGHNKFLSNFSSVPIIYEGELYPTLEHAYQAAKFPIGDHKKLIQTAPTPSKAKKLGQYKGARTDWDVVRLSVMETLLRLKFSNPVYKVQLLHTKDAHLEEGNDHGDMFWGTVEGQGQNNLGKLLMKIRNDLR